MSMDVVFRSGHIYIYIHPITASNRYLIHAISCTLLIYIRNHTYIANGCKYLLVSHEHKVALRVINNNKNDRICTACKLVYTTILLKLQLFFATILCNYSSH